jgi:Mor family transcriptional regulator
MHDKNRAPSQKGSNNGRAKLNDKLILEIVNEFALGATYQELADEYNVTTSLIGQIIKGNIWKHVKRPKYNNLNNIDKYSSNRHMCKLQPEDIPEIIERFNKGETYSDLAKEFNVSYNTIRRIIIGESWKDYQ